MGLIRKAMSVSTLGAVDMRSDKERTAAYAKSTKKQAKAQTRIMRAALADQKAARNDMPGAVQPPAPSPWSTPMPAPIQAMPAPTQPVPAGWFQDPLGTPQQRYWDGSVWTNEIAPLSPPT